MQFARASSPWLSSGEIITGATVVESSGGLAITSVSNQSSEVFFFVASGVAEGVYTVDVGITTNQGRQVVRSFEIGVVRPKMAS